MNEEGIKGKSCLTRHGLAFAWEKRAGKQSQASSVCVFCFCPLAFICFLFTPATFSAASLPPSLNWLGGSSHDQACQPGNYLALSNKAATDSNEEWNIKERHCLCSDGSSARRRRRGDLRARGSCREAATTLSLPFLHKYHQCRQQSRTCPGSPERVYLYHTARLSVISCWYPWWWLQCNVNKRGSALLSDLADALPAARLPKGQRLEMHESKRALKLSRVQRSPGASLLSFHLDFMLLYKKKRKNQTQDKGERVKPGSE